MTVSHRLPESWHQSPLGVFLSPGHHDSRHLPLLSTSFPAPHNCSEIRRGAFMMFPSWTREFFLEFRNRICRLWLQVRISFMRTPKLWTTRSATRSDINRTANRRMMTVMTEPKLYLYRQRNDSVARDSVNPGVSLSRQTLPPPLLIPVRTKHWADLSGQRA